MKYFLLLILVIGCAGSQKPAEHISNTEDYQRFNSEPTTDSSHNVPDDTTEVHCYGSVHNEQCVKVKHKIRKSFWENQ
jgi:hypothetical protein